MAKKGQKFNSYIFDVKEMVLDEYKEKHNIKYDNRLETVINNTISKNGYFKFLNKFTYLYSNDCYWLKDYDENGVERIFTVQPFNTEMMKITSEKTSKCKVIPVIIANKPNKIAQ